MLLVALHLGRANQSVNLAWDANPEPDIAKYKVYWGLESGAPTESLDIGKVTAATVRHLDDGATYFFTVTAINKAGEESEPSNEVSTPTPSHPPRLHTLTVVSGTGSGPYPPGKWVPVHANPPNLENSLSSGMVIRQSLTVRERMRIMKYLLSKRTSPSLLCIRRYHRLL